VKNHNAESKIIVCGITVYLAKVASLEFRRGEVRFANGASEKASSSHFRDLHGVTIYQSHKCPIRHQKVALIEIAYDVATCVNGFHDAGDIRSAPEQITPVESRGHLLPILRIIELQHRHVRGEVHPMHEKPRADFRLTKKKGLGPTDRNVPLAAGRISRGAADHSP
jgi:hypothetical protein